MSFSNVFWVLLLAFVFYVGFKVVPIYYRGIIGLPGVCQEQADVYHKYGQGYVSARLEESLAHMGISKDNRKHNVQVTEEAVVVTIDYWDTATFFDRYTKEFSFHSECEGVLRSVYD